MEIEEIPDAIENLLTRGDRECARIAERIQNIAPTAFISVARGSSDHACSYLKYASEILLGIPMASFGPSVASVYAANLKAANMVGISVSQSGKSPDIIAATRTLECGGAYTIAITNDPSSPLANAANAALAIEAGDELSVAATKTFVSSAVAGLWLLAKVKGDDALCAAIRELPMALEQAIRCDWVQAIPDEAEKSLFTLGRGPSYAIACEAALKFKETCRLHAESYSAAEVLHGPVSIVERDFPILIFTAGDASEVKSAEVADQLSEQGASVFITSDLAQKATPLPRVRTQHWLTDPIALIVSFYGMVENLAIAKGLDPDLPRHLAKVTKTT